MHTGRAYVGFVGSGKVIDFTALGDEVNVVARLASAAGIGEIFVSAMTQEVARLETVGLEHRQLSLKGKSTPADVWVVTVAEPAVGVQ